MLECSSLYVKGTGMYFVRSTKPRAVFNLLEQCGYPNACAQINNFFSLFSSLTKEVLKYLTKRNIPNELFKFKACSGGL